MFDLNIDYTDAELKNPETQRNDKVRLRSYVGTGTSEDTPFVAPTIEAKPGDTVRINLNNKLPIHPSPDCKDSRDTEDENQPNCKNYNRTNLHSHGLWISPSGNSDNVLISIDPEKSFTYEYNIPSDHPAGTFWYHPHLHGSTAIQVSSGMVGAFIIKGDRLPQETANGDIYKGDIDKLLNAAGIKERILVLQQIQYACGEDTNGNPNWNCKDSDIGKIESYKGFFSNWATSGRYTSINGEVLPTFPDAKTGQIERWRIIHGGVRATINLEFRKEIGNTPNFNTLKAADANAYIRKNCTGDPIPYHVIADDGLTRSKAWKTTLTTLQPGYRSDALVIFPEAGSYCVIDSSAPAGETVSGNAESRQLLGVVEVTKGEGELKSLTTQLINAANTIFPDQGQENIKQIVVHDLNDGLKLSAFTPHAKITDDQVQGAEHKQELSFKIQGGYFQISNKINNPGYKSYQHDRIDRKLKLGSADEWTLHSAVGSHPFHIHVNPFQIVKILNDKNEDVTDSDPEYKGLKNVWKDTLFVKSGYKITVRTHYERYIGDFVIHCHILDHEDQGMMQNVSIVLPNHRS